VPCPYSIIFGRDTALPSPLYHSGAAGIDITQASTSDVKKTCAIRWKIEEFHREVNQLTGIESCQCRETIIQINYIACTILVWNQLKKLADLT
jgi:hypothetical protein